MNDNQYTVEAGERDPVRPPGLFLVLIAMLALGGLGYAIIRSGLQYNLVQRRWWWTIRQHQSADSPTGK